MVSLITGATGFIGKRLAKKLRQNGDFVRILSRNQCPDYETVVCDLERDTIPSSAFESVDTVFHLAGFAHDMSDATKMKNLYYKLNVEATIRLAEAAVKYGIKQFVFISSTKAGGRAKPKMCMTELDQGEPEGIYGQTKREAEIRLLEIGKKFNICISIIRPTLVYGPGVKGNLRIMLSGIEKGWFPPLPDVGNIRSMIHVDDLVLAILLLAQSERANGEIFITTDGVPYSSRDIYETMCDVVGKSVPKWSVPKFFFDMIAFISPRIKYKVDKLLGDECYSSEKLELLGFKPQKTLKEMNETSF